MPPIRLFALLTLTGLAGPVSAQLLQPKGPPLPPRPDGRSPTPRLGPDVQRHFEPDDAQAVPDFRKWLLGLNKKSLPKNMDPKLLKELMDRLPKEQKADQKQIEELLKQNPKFKDPAFLKQLGEMVESPDFPKNLEGKLPPNVQPPPPEQGPDLEEKFKQVIEEGQKNPVIPEGGPKGDPTTGPKVDPSQLDPSKIDPKAASPAGENEWAKWLDKNFGDSPTGQAALKDLMSALEKQDMKGMFDQVPEFKNGGWKDLDSWGKANAGDLWKMKPPDLSGNKVTPPKIGGGSGGTSLGGGGGSGGSSGSGFGGGGAGLGGGWTALAVIVGIASAILLAALLLRKWKLTQAERSAVSAAGKAGLDLDSIRTREELVRAFDHVSLDQIGEEARNWNHRVIAEQIAEVRPTQAEPADELAGLYERARYAPLDEDLSAGEFADARRDLRVIAGVPA